MTLEKAIEVLTAHNIWRREPGGPEFATQGQGPIEIGLAIAFAVSALKKQLSPLPKIEKQDETTGSAPN